MSNTATAQITEMLPRMKPRVLTLGECFILELAKVPRGRGLTAVYEHIVTVVGDIYGTRNTFAKLQNADSFASLNSKDRMRAWILMATLGMNPDDFGGSNAIVPPSFDLIELRTALLLPELDSNQQPAGGETAAPVLAPVTPLPRRTVVAGESHDAAILAFPSAV